MDNKVEKKWFLESEVRVVNGEYIVLKDVFASLGRLREDGQIQTTDRNKVIELSELGIVSAGENFTISSKGKKKSKNVQSVDCVKMSDVPLILTQFKPSKTKEAAMNTWVEFMKFVNCLLTSLEVHKYIVTDKKQQLKHQDIVEGLGGKAMRMNVMICDIMAKLIGVEGRVKKDDLRFYQDQTTIDLLEVHEFVVQQFENAYRFTKSHAMAKDMAYKSALEEYPFEVAKSA